MLASSKIGLGTLAFNEWNTDSISVASTSLVGIPFNNIMKQRIAAYEPCFGFFKNVQVAGGCVAGGFARNVLGITFGITASDIDIFCIGDYRDIIERFVLKPQGFLEGKVININSRKVGYVEERMDLTDVRYVSANYKQLGNLKYQFIDTVSKTTEEIISAFDISVCCVYLDFEKEMVFCTKEFLEDESERNLRVINIRYDHPIKAILYRVQKYLEKGYKFHLNEIVRIEEALKNHKEFHEEIDSVFSPGVLNLPNYFHKKEDYKLLVGIKNMINLPENLLRA